MSHKRWFVPEWGCPPNVKAIITNRVAGVSQAPYAHFNLATHVGDQVELVHTNRAWLKKKLGLETEPCWLSQVHGTQAVYVSPKRETSVLEADASYTDYRRQACVVMTADCLPILVANKQGTWVAAIHAGWRGLLAGVIESTLQHYVGDKHDLLIYFGPGISQDYFEVGEDVYKAFVRKNKESQNAFRRSTTHSHKFYADLFLLAKQRCVACGIPQSHLTGGHDCTYAKEDLFYSYRREGQTGRFASLIWLE